MGPNGRFHRALERARPHDELDKMRPVQRAQIDETIIRLWERLDQAAAVPDIGVIVNALVKVWAHEARLFGLTHADGIDERRQRLSEEHSRIFQDALRLVLGEFDIPWTDEVIIKVRESIEAAQGEPA